jgi:hypothetical protein
MNDICLSIECAGEPIVAHAQSVVVLTFQTLVRRRIESKPRLIDLNINSRLAFGRGSGLARAGTEAIGDLSLGLLNSLFEFRSELQSAFDQIIDPLANPTQFNLRKLFQFRLDLLDLAHGGMMHRSRGGSQLELAL